MVSTLFRTAGALALALQVHLLHAEDLRVVLPRADSALARDYADGARLYFTHVNATGGAHGYTILARAGSGEPTPGAIAYLAVDPAEAASQPEVPVLTRAAVTSAQRERLVFSTRPGAAQEAVSTVRRLFEMGLRKIAVVVPATAEGTATAAAAASALSALGARTIPSLSLDPQGAGVDAAAARLAAANPQAVLLATDTPLAARFIPALREQRSFALVVTSSSVDARALVSQLPPPSAIWLATADLLPKVDDPRHGEALVAEYRELQARYGAAGPFIAPAALEGFIAAKVLIEAVRRADGRPTPAAVRTALANLADFNVGAGSVSFRDPAQSGLAYARISLLMPR